LADEHVLVVDDEEQVVKVVETALATQGYRAYGTIMPDKALDMVKSHPIDLVISDVLMPGIDGIALMKKVHWIREDAGFIMISGVDEVDMSVQAMKLGALDYLVKPFTIEALLRAVRNALDKHKLQMENRYYQLDLEKRVLERTRQLARVNRKMKQVALQVIESLANTVEVKDPYTRGHSDRVCRYSVLVAEAFGSSERDKQLLHISSLLHDIGKIGVRDSILLKPGPLSDQEWEEMRRHPEFGKRILEPIDIADEIKEWTYHHHERYDGTGYPDGLAGDAIPFGARILIAAEVFDALTTERVYKPAWPLTEVSEFFKEHSRKHFHPEIVDALVEIIQERGQEVLTRDSEASFFRAAVADPTLWMFWKI